MATAEVTSKKPDVKIVGTVSNNDFFKLLKTKRGMASGKLFVDNFRAAFKENANQKDKKLYVKIQVGNDEINDVELSKIEKNGNGYKAEVFSDEGLIKLSIDMLTMNAEFQAEISDN